jgi:fatty-acyl-CoA synthase
MADANVSQKEITSDFFQPVGWFCPGRRLFMAVKRHPVTIADFARMQAAAQPDKIALKFEGDALTYGALERGSNQTANGLIAARARPGDRIAYLGKNSHIYYEILMGAAKAGAVTCPVNWRLAPPEIAYILKDSGARILFVGPEFITLIETATSLAPALETIICVEENDAGLPDYKSWRSTFDDTDPCVARESDDDAVQLYTSGTTGHPKGAVLSHRALLSSYVRSQGNDNPAWNAWNADDVSLVAMPCFHIGGTAWGLTGLSHGATGVVMREFDPLKVLEFIDAHRISKLFLVPAAMQIVVNQPRAREVDFSPLKYMLYGASPIPLELLKQCMDVFKCGFVQMYGMTETSGTIVALPPEDHDPQGNERMRSAGKPLPGVEVAILNDDGASPCLRTRSAKSPRVPI